MTESFHLTLNEHHFHVALRDDGYDVEWLDCPDDTYPGGYSTWMKVVSDDDLCPMKCDCPDEHSEHGELSSSGGVDIHVSRESIIADITQWISAVLTEHDDAVLTERDDLDSPTTHVPVNGNGEC